MSIVLRVKPDRLSIKYRDDEDEKQLTGILAAVLVLGFGTVNAFAAGHGMYYVDADNDGICDNYANGTCPGNPILSGSISSMSRTVSA